ncbi:MAG: urease accessory protein UreE [Exilibacterium sp.]
MLKVYKRYPVDTCAVDDELILPYDLRQKGRLKAITVSGNEVGLFLERGQPLKEGERLQTQCGKRIKVTAAAEPVVTATSADWQTFSRVCYHLGNRHIPLQISELWLRFKPDHVLEDMVRRFGLSIVQEQAPFEPEAGAYAGHGHHHEH